MFSLIKLGRAGKMHRNNACAQLQNAINYLYQAKDLLKQEKGIGAEFFIEKIDDYIDDAKNCKRKMSALD